VHRKKLLQIAIGVAVAIVVILPLGVLAYVKSGIYSVAASSPHTKFTEWITHETMIHSVRTHASSIEAPAKFSPAEVRRGFCAYELHCVACHGASAVARQLWVSGMEPSPPYLLDVTQRFEPRELFWIAKNGIKMTGMPAWRNSMSDGQLWDLVAFLETMPKMNSLDYVQWRQAGVCAVISERPTPAPHSIPHP